MVCLRTEMKSQQNKILSIHSTTRSAGSHQKILSLLPYVITVNIVVVIVVVIIIIIIIIIIITNVFIIVIMMMIIAVIITIFRANYILTSSTFSREETSIHDGSSAINYLHETLGSSTPNPTFKIIYFHGIVKRDINCCYCFIIFS